MNQLLLLGVNHKFAPLPLRERLAFHPERIPAALQSMSEMDANGETAREVALLSTCNRTEVYTWTPDPPAAQAYILHYLARHAGLDSGELQSLVYVQSGEAAAGHLLRVAAGLDSLVLGENEILGQVKHAHEQAQQAGSSGPVLSALFRSAIQTGKRVRSETELGRASLSVARVVVELAEEWLGPLSERTALLIGAGKISSITAQALKAAGLHCILIANRTFERAQRLAERSGGQALHFDALPSGLEAADIVICSTGAPHLVLHLDAVQAAMQKRPQRALLVADLAVPRDADPSIARLPNVRLTDIDALEDLVQRRHPLAAAVRRQAETIVCQGLQDFNAWLDARQSAPVIQALRAQADAICQAQVTKTLRRMGELTPEQQRAIQVMGQAIIGQLLHEPITHLRQAPDPLEREQFLALAKQLYGLERTLS